MTELAFASAVLTPLLSLLFSFLLSNSYRWLFSMMSASFVLTAWIAATYLLIQPGEHLDLHLDASWLSIGKLHIAASVSLTDLGRLMLFMITFVSFVVHLFSLGYMAGDQREKSYFAVLGFFTFAMSALVVADNLVMLFVFWEMIGLSSYLLIGHYREKVAAGVASNKAFLMNRVGDIGFLLAIMMTWNAAGTLSIRELYAQHPAPSLFISVGFFLAVIAKSAQLPLSTWLSDAMEGPTPVSALIHAATMVAAGVFLLVRLQPLIAPEILPVILATGLATSLMGALAACVHTDLKKVLAFSTISQLGLMVAAYGAGSPQAALFHLFSHAFFKAGLFLVVGAIMYAVHQAQQRENLSFDSQSLYTLGGLRQKMPVTFLVALCCFASLSGLPFFSGFVSKEFIYLSIYHPDQPLFLLAFGIVLIISLLTVFYSIRFIYFVFIRKPTYTMTTVTDPPWVMKLPLILLAALSFWWINGSHPFAMPAWMGSRPVPFVISMVSIMVLITGGYVGLRLREHKIESSLFFRFFYLDEWITRLVVSPFQMIVASAQYVDRKWIDGFLHSLAYVHVTIAHIAGWIDRALIDGMVSVSAGVIRTMGSLTRSFQGGNVQLYILWSVLSAVIFLFWLIIL